jgi:hypothetical protein
VQRGLSIVFLHGGLHESRARVLRVLSTRPTDEGIFHLEHEEVNPRKVEQEPEEGSVPLPVPVGGTTVILDGTVSSKISELMKQRVRLADQPTFRTWGRRAITVGSWKS